MDYNKLREIHTFFREDNNINSIKKIIETESLSIFQLIGIFKLVCYHGNLMLAKLIYETHVGMRNICVVEYTNAFQFACSSNIELAKWLYTIQPKIRLDYDDYFCFRYACTMNNHEMIKWIYSITSIPFEIFKIGFKEAIKSGGIELIKSLNIKKDIIQNINTGKISNVYIINNICKKGCMVFAEWFYDNTNLFKNVHITDIITNTIRNLRGKNKFCNNIYFISWLIEKIPKLRNFYKIEFSKQHKIICMIQYRWKSKLYNPHTKRGYEYGIKIITPYFTH